MSVTRTLLTRDLFAVANFLVLFVCLLGPAALLQDIIKDDEIKLDWFFKTSLIHDVVSVSVRCSSIQSAGVLLAETDDLTIGRAHALNALQLVPVVV